MEPDDELVHHVQPQDILTGLRRELDLGIQCNLILWWDRPTQRGPQTVSDHDSPIGSEPLVGQVYRVRTIGRPGERSNVAHPDWEPDRLAHCSLRGCIHRQPLYPVEWANLNPLRLPGW